ncbi:MFS transporter [Asanoa ishikariensis]|uniref:Drug resistance transporter, EmrB/QacA subfamily n=1 Tax=Asanoa ishikariensis TaxID=137265 RepID=A0A1H3L5J9_9ACTN|nr:MFS transporter [Asanoa ishikariensis]GIF69510.1 MFS transporter [Asanoa ishikariensis]SDY59218.1 drug resistance transporter, EmrB/QacA subfamily [Asanoa ishikariensis]
MENRNPHRWWILVVLCLSSLVLVVDSMALTVAVPHMTADLGATAQDMQWILDSYILVFAGLLLTSGSLGDRFGRRKIMIIGLLLFGAASLAATFVADPAQMIAVRVAMGVGGALIMPSTLSILITVFDATERPKAMAAWGSVSMLGLVGSPVLGGLLVDRFSWQSIFWINVPIVVLAIAAGLALMPESKGPWQKPDPIGAVLSAAGMTALVWWIIELPHHGAFGERSGITLAVAVVGLVGFVVWENITPAPMVPLGLFKHRKFSGGSLSLSLVQIGNGGLLLVLTQYLQFVLGYSPLKAGLAFVPLAVAALAGNGVGVKLVATIGERYVMLIGMVVMAGSFGLLTTVSATSGFAIPAIALGLLGLGAGLAMPAAVTALMGTIPPEQAGVGSALNDTIQQAGSALGIAILGSLLTSGFASRMPAGAPAEARHSIAGALADGDPGLVAAAREAFTASMSTTFTISAIGVLAAAVVATVIMRDRKPAPAEVEELELAA